MSATVSPPTLTVLDFNVDERHFNETMVERLQGRNLTNEDFQALERYFRNQVWHNHFALRNAIGDILLVQVMKDYQKDDRHYHEIWRHVNALDRELDMSPSLYAAITPELIQEEYDEVRETLGIPMPAKSPYSLEFFNNLKNA